MNESDTSAWILTLPCTREEAERLDAAAEALFSDLPTPPVFSFSEDPEDEAGPWLMQAYFELEPPAVMIRAIQAMIPSAAKAKPQVAPVPAEDWVTLSQSALPPITAGHFHVRNGHDDVPLDGHTNFLIPASRAFGTGQHETTHGCLLMLDRLKAQGHRFGNIADIGTGTGLLAFAALDLWPRAHIIASDIDPDAMEVVAENMALNDLPEGVDAGQVMLVTAAGTGHPEIRARAPYDLLIANILAGPLTALAPAFAGQIAEGGSLILAGLLDTQADRLIAAYARHGLRLAARADRQGWPTLHLRKRHRYGHRRPARWSEDGGSITPGFGTL